MTASETVCVSVRQQPDSCWPSWQGWRYTAPYGCHDARDEMPPTIDALLRDLRDHADEEFGVIYRWAAARNDSCRADGRREKVASRVALSRAPPEAASAKRRARRHTFTRGSGVYFSNRRGRTRADGRTWIELSGGAAPILHERIL